MINVITAMVGVSNNDNKFFSPIFYEKYYPLHILHLY